MSLRTAQKRAQEDAQEVPLEVQNRDRDRFIKRAQKRIAQIDEDRASEVRSLGEAERKLNDLQVFRTVQVDPASTPLPELEQLQMRVAQMQAQNEELLSSSNRQAVGSGARVLVTGRFCSLVRRGSRAVDARSPVGYARCDSSRECPRVGEIVPSCGLRSAINGCKCGQGSLRNSIDSRTGQHSVEARSRIARSPNVGSLEPRSQA